MELLKIHRQWGLVVRKALKEGMNMSSHILSNTRLLTRLVWAALIGVIGSALFFAGFYYTDRYFHLDDFSPLEMRSTDLETQVRQNPNDLETRLALAEQYLRNHNDTAAIDQAQQVISSDPENDRALFVLGMAHSNSGEIEAGVRYLEQFVALHQKGAGAPSDMALQTGLYYLGVNYLNIGRSEEAKTVLSRALSINSTDADTLYQLGLVHLRTAQYQLALEYFQKAVLFVPDYLEAYKGMEDCYTALQQPDYALVAQGMQAYSLKEYEKANQLLGEAVEKLPNEAQVNLGLGLAREQLGDLLSAQQYFMRTLALDANNFTASNALERVQTAMDQGE